MMAECVFLRVTTGVVVAGDDNDDDERWADGNLKPLVVVWGRCFLAWELPAR